LDGGYNTILVEVVGEEHTGDKCRLAQPSLPHDHQGEVKASLDGLAVDLLLKVGKSNHRLVIILQYSFNILNSEICRQGFKIFNRDSYKFN